MRLAFGIISLSIVGIDAWTKHVAERALSLPGRTVVVIDGLLSMTLVHNTGAAFGLFASWDPRLSTRLLNAVGVVALLLVGWVALRSPHDRFRLQSSLSLILGGAIGNLADRLAHGHVVDFIEVYWRTFQWPNFNVADSAISVGVVLLLIDAFLAPPESLAPAGEPGEPPPCTRS